MGTARCNRVNPLWNEALLGDGEFQRCDIVTDEADFSLALRSGFICGAGDGEGCLRAVFRSFLNLGPVTVFSGAVIVDAVIDI